MTAAMVAESHQIVYDFVAGQGQNQDGQDRGYGYDTSILAHTPDEVRVLLNCP